MWNNPEKAAAPSEYLQSLISSYLDPSQLFLNSDKVITQNESGKQHYFILTNSQAMHTGHQFILSLGCSPFTYSWTVFSSD